MRRIKKALKKVSCRKIFVVKENLDRIGYKIVYDYKKEYCRWLNALRKRAK